MSNTASPQKTRTANALTRRAFLSKTAIAGGLFLLLPSGCRRGPRAPSNRIAYALVGAGGQGLVDARGVTNCKGVQLVAVCDPDRRHLDAAGREFAARFPAVARFTDYREMFAKLGDGVDAVSVSTPDHAHYTVAAAAVARGKHVYVQKPLCHSVDQVRRLTAAARAKGVVTQMGNQGSSNPALPAAREWFEAGLFGEVVEAVSWSNRPIWPQGMDGHAPPAPVPAALDWHLWLGPAPHIEYHEKIHPFDWRGYYAFGNGTLGDILIHNLYDAYYTLQLTAPSRIEVVSVSGRSPVAFPKSSKIIFHFPAANGRGPVRYTWMDGGQTPARFFRECEGVETGGTLLYGSQLPVMLVNTAGFVPLLERGRRRPVAPAQRYPRVKGGHYLNWINGITRGTPTLSDFAITGAYAEIVLLGVIAQRLGRTLDWDAAAGAFKKADGSPDAEANALLKAPVPREGFEA